MLLTKGFEVEMYTGMSDGTIVGLSDRIVADLDGFVREPDSRNVEYTTAPFFQYERLLCELLRPRQKLRTYLKKIGDYTIIPGSTLALGGGDYFVRSDPGNPYHDYIEHTYGTKVVTASIHINVGISDVEDLMRACRVIRVEAPLYLALSASSPFFDGHVTGHHSTRWKMFPQTPSRVPLFESHAHFVKWTEEQLLLGTMQSVRHLWSSVRPNGDRRPYCLNRLELRICDLVTDPIALLAITALLEARLLQVLADPSIDPLTQSKFSSSSQMDTLLELVDQNEDLAAHRSLDAELRHWIDGRPILARKWIEEMYADVWATAKTQGFSCFLSPIKKILREGNEAQRWLSLHHQGMKSESILRQAIQRTLETEIALEDELCHSQSLVA